MNNNNSNLTEKIYDEEECLAYIRQYNPSSSTLKALSDDDLTYIVDLIYEYMERNGLIPEDEDEGNDDEEFEIDLDDVFQFVTKNIKRDKMEITLSAEDFTCIYDAETEYSESLLN